MNQLALGIVGLGRMGANMARRLARGGVTVVAHDRSTRALAELSDEAGVAPTETLEALIAALPPPRTVWLMVPAGSATEELVKQCAELLQPGDLLVDGGNAFYKDSMRRGLALEQRGILFADCGVSGGVWGLEQGYALMFGGGLAVAERLRPYVRVLAPHPERGWLHCGPVGAGHFVKMVHNGIEYGMMQALAEGFSLMRNKAELELDLAAVAETWRHGSVIRSWLLDIVAELLQGDDLLQQVQPLVADSGEGRWTALEAIEQGVPTPVIASALFSRFASQGSDDYAARLLAMMRLGFGGHAVSRTR